MARFLLIILLISCYLCSDEPNYHKSQAITCFNSISSEEQKNIKTLFEILFFKQSFAYSLFGDKPMTLSTNSLEEYSSDGLVKLINIDGYCEVILTPPYSNTASLLKEDLSVWKKHESKFGIENYLFITTKIADQIYIAFINKRAFKETVNDHIKLFRRMIHPTLSWESLLEEIQNENKDLLDTLHRNKILLGILLGFGKHNASLFQRREELLNALGKDLRKSELLEEKIKTLNSKLQFFHDYDPAIIATINRVHFVADPSHPETIWLRKKYDALTKIINKIHSANDWFEQTLFRLLD